MKEQLVNFQADLEPLLRQYPGIAVAAGELTEHGWAMTTLGAKQPAFTVPQVLDPDNLLNNFALWAKETHGVTLDRNEVLACALFAGYLTKRYAFESRQ